MVGETGVVEDELNPEGRVKIGAEFWRARTKGEVIEAGAMITVTGGSRLKLEVKALDESQ